MKAGCQFNDTVCLNAGMVIHVAMLQEDKNSRDRDGKHGMVCQKGLYRQRCCAGMC